MKLLYNFIFHNPDKKVTIQAFFLSAWARTLIFFIPISRMRPFLGQTGIESPHGQLPHEHHRIIRQIAFRVSRVANRTPWESKCFVQALVAQWLLYRHHLPSTLYLGVGKNESQEMIAHAWIRCGNHYVTGGTGENYAIVAKFTRIPRNVVQLDTSAVSDAAVTPNTLVDEP